MAQAVDEVFNCPPIHNLIFSCLSPPDIYRARRVSRLFFDAVNHFHDLAYNMNRHLSPFLNDPTAFRRIQAEEDFLVSGSTALQFLDRTRYPGSDIDIFAYPESVKTIGNHLIEAEGYEFVPAPNKRKGQKLKFEDNEIKQRVFENFDSERRSHSQHAFVYTSGMSELFKFKRASSDTEIQIISTARSPLDCILHFHSSCVMNFFTHLAAYSLYPRATFDKREALKFGDTWSEGTTKAYIKYSARGWTFRALDFANVLRMNGQLFCEQPRFIDDAHVWRVPLNTDQLNFDTTSHFNSLDSTNPFHSNAWVLKRNFDGFSTQMTLGIGYQYLYSPSEFQRTYLILNTTFRDHLDDLIARADPSSLQDEYLDHLIPSARAAYATHQTSLREGRPQATLDLRALLGD